MTLVLTSIPNLIGGISQQSPAARNPNQAETADNCYGSPIEGLVKRPPSEPVFPCLGTNGEPINGDSTKEFKAYQILRDLDERYFVVFRTVGGFDTVDIWNITTGAGQTVRYGDAEATNNTSINYFSTVSNLRDSVNALTIGDVSFVASTAQTVDLTSDVVGTPVNDGSRQLIHIKQSNYNRTWKLQFFEAGTNAPIGLKATYSTPNTTTAGAVGTNSVAGGIKDAWDDMIGQTDLITLSVNDGVILATHTDGDPISVIIQDDFAGDGTLILDNEIERFEDLPMTAKHGWSVKVSGAPESTFDDYWVKFEADTGGFSKGIWRETIGPGLRYKIDPETAPHILIRKSNGDFVYKQANGLGNFPDYMWAERKVGDDVTNPVPTFVGGSISNLVLFKNRLCFLSGENCILSEVSEFFNFWLTTVLELGDSETIDIASTSPKVGNLKSAIPFNTELILFSDFSQFALRSGTQVLSTTNVAMVNVGEYEVQGSVDPISSGLSVYFGYNRGSGFSGLRELVPQASIDGSYVVNTLSDYVPNLILGTITTVAASDQEDLTIVVADDKMYLYKYLKRGDDLVLSAWSTAHFPDTSSTNAKIIWCGFIESDLYMCMLRDNGLAVERMRFSADQNDLVATGQPWLLHLDSRLRVTNGVYDTVADTTTWSMPAPYGYTAGLTEVYTTGGLVLGGATGTAYVSSGVPGTVVVSGNYSGSTVVWVGLKYPMTYTFSEFFIRARRMPIPELTGRTQLRNISIRFEETAFFQVQVDVLDGEAYLYTYSGVPIGQSLLGSIHPDQGNFRVPIYGANSSTTVTIKNNTALPCKLLGAEVEIEYTNRATRIN